jgi:hypothetical protein
MIGPELHSFKISHSLREVDHRPVGKKGWQLTLHPPGNRPDIVLPLVGTITEVSDAASLYIHTHINPTMDL